MSWWRFFTEAYLAASVLIVAWAGLTAGAFQRERAVDPKADFYNTPQRTMLMRILWVYLALSAVIYAHLGLDGAINATRHLNARSDDFWFVGCMIAGAILEQVATMLLESDTPTPRLWAQFGAALVMAPVIFIWLGRNKTQFSLATAGAAVLSGYFWKSIAQTIVSVRGKA